MASQLGSARAGLRAQPPGPAPSPCAGALRGAIWEPVLPAALPGGSLEPAAGGGLASSLCPDSSCALKGESPSALGEWEELSASAPPLLTWTEVFQPQGSSSLACHLELGSFQHLRAPYTHASLMLFLPPGHTPLPSRPGS